MNYHQDHNTVIRVGLADDDLLTRSALEAILGAFVDIKLQWSVDSGEAAVRHVLESSHPIDVLLFDIQMSGIGGIGACRRVNKFNPVLPVIILTTFAPELYLNEALEAGAKGFLVKDDAPNVIADAIRSVHHGASILSASAAAQLSRTAVKNNRTVSVNNPLTGREAEILKLVAKSLTNRQIALRLGIAEPTVKAHISAIIAKLNCTDRVGMVIWGYENGILNA